MARGIGAHVLLAAVRKRVERSAVGRDHGVHVIRRLHAALDLERGHARVGKLGKVINNAIVLGAERPRAAGGFDCVALLIRHVIRQTARLRAEAAVSRAPARERAHHAHAGVAEAEGPVAKGLKLHALLRNGAHLVERELARERHTANAQLAAPGRASGVVHVCLGGDVALDLRPAAAYLGEKPPVLDNEGIRAKQPSAADKLEHLRNLARCDGNVHRHVDASAGKVRPAARLAKGLFGKVVRTAAGVEIVAQTAVDGVGTGSQRGVERLWPTGGRQELYAP